MRNEWLDKVLAKATERYEQLPAILKAQFNNPPKIAPGSTQLPAESPIEKRNNTP